MKHLKRLSFSSNKVITLNAAKFYYLKKKKAQMSEFVFVCKKNIGSKYKFASFQVPAWFVSCSFFCFVLNQTN